MELTKLSLLKEENLIAVTNQIMKGNTIVLVVPPAIILIEKFGKRYEMNTINRTDNSWEVMKHDDYSLKVTLGAIFQTSEIRKAKKYLCECRNDAKKAYIEIADALLLEDNKGKKIITIETEMD